MKVMSQSSRFGLRGVALPFFLATLLANLLMAVPATGMRPSTYSIRVEARRRASIRRNGREWPSR